MFKMVNTYLHWCSSLSLRQRAGPALDLSLHNNSVRWRTHINFEPAPGLLTQDTRTHTSKTGAAHRPAETVQKDRRIAFSGSVSAKMVSES